MIKELLGAASALALFAGVAAAQDAATTTTPTTPPGATPTPPAEATMPTPPPATAAAPADAAPAGMPPTEQAVAPEPAAPPAATPVPAPVETAAPMPEPATPPPAAEPATSPAAPAVETAAPAPEPAPAATAAAGSAGKPVSADDMMGRQVEGTDGQSIGRISDVLVDPASGQIQRLVIASGGFLGLGAKNVALEFDKVEVRPEGGIVAMGVTREAIEGMPEYDVAAETAPLDARPEPPATTGAAGGIATPGVGAGGAVAPAPGQTAQ